MFLVINGQDYDDLPEPLSVSGLIEYLGLPKKKVAIELNREVVSKSTYQNTDLTNGDKLEIIHFIGGG